MHKKLVVLQVKINGHPTWALVDTGLLGDFISSTLADQLRVKKRNLGISLGLQLTVQRSCSKINTSTEARFQYQGIDFIWHFDIINLNS
jgi:Aspartyl protease